MRRRAPVSLRLVALELWPALAGYAATPSEDRLTAALTAAAYLHARCDDLVLRRWMRRDPGDPEPTYAPGDHCPPAPSRRGRPPAITRRRRSARGGPR